MPRATTSSYTALKKALVEYNAVLIPLAVIGLLLIWFSRGENYASLILGAVLTALSPLVSYFVVVMLHKRSRDKRY